MSTPTRNFSLFLLKRPRDGQHTTVQLTQSTSAYTSMSPYPNASAEVLLEIRLFHAGLEALTVLVQQVWGNAPQRLGTESLFHLATCSVRSDFNVGRERFARRVWRACGRV